MIFGLIYVDRDDWMMGGGKGGFKKGGKGERDGEGDREGIKIRREAKVGLIL